MSLASFSVHLRPTPASPFAGRRDVGVLSELGDRVRVAWPEVSPDEIEMARLFPPKTPSREILYWQGEAGLFQISLSVGERQPEQVGAVVRMAHANPPSVVEPYLAMVEWTMREFQMDCRVQVDLAPEQQGVPDVVSRPEDLRAVLVPAIEYHRWVWRADFGPESEAVIRPGDAVARFVIPQTEPL